MASSDGRKGRKGCGRGEREGRERKKGRDGEQEREKGLETVPGAGREKIVG